MCLPPAICELAKRAPRRSSGPGCAIAASPELKFRRQHPVGPFVVDFCCPDRRLVIELDGAVHLSPAQRQHDAEREALLAAAGYTILRFPNAAVHDDLAGVLATIRATAEAQCGFHPSPPAAPPRTGAW